MDSAWSRGDRAGLWVILGATALYALGVLVFGAAGVIGEVASGVYRVTLLVDQPLPPEADTGTATLVYGTYETAFVAAGHLTGATQALIMAGRIIGTVSQLGVAIAFAYLGWRLLRRRPFLASLSRTFLAAGATLALGGLVAQFLLGFGGWNVTIELGNDGPDGFWPLMMTLDPGSIGLGFALMLVGSAFHYGVRLTRETEGLV